MNLGKSLAMTAVTGMLAGALAACGGNTPEAKDPSATDPSTNAAPPATEEKSCCSGKNECKGKSGCKAGDNASCAGQNECKGKGTSCPKADG